MSVEHNETVVRRWIDAYNARDKQAEADARSPGYVAHVPGTSGPLDAEAWVEFIDGFADAFPDLRLTIENIVSSGDMVAARVSFHGTHRGEFQGLPPTNREVAFTGMEFDRMADDGKVAEHWVELDRVALLQQLA